MAVELGLVKISSKETSSSFWDIRERRRLWQIQAWQQDSSR
jgi:hypothetical protein